LDLQKFEELRHDQPGLRNDAAQRTALESGPSCRQCDRNLPNARRRCRWDRFAASGHVFHNEPNGILRHRKRFLLVEIINNRRRITADTALRLSLNFGKSAEFWMNLQTHYDLKIARRNLKPEDAKRIRALRAA
jgi:hypothetical protein